MARKSTYIYRVTMGYGKDNPQQVAFCYARNSTAAKEGMREIYKDKKYDRFETVMFGEADRIRHPELFMPMPKDEVDYIAERNLGQGDAYAQRKTEYEAKFVPVGEEL